MHRPRSATSEPADEPIEVAGPQSPLSLLRGKRAALEAALHLDLCVPRWDEALGGRKLWVRYRPGDVALLTAAQERRKTQFDKEKAKTGGGDPQWQVKAHADMLAAACMAVYDLGPDEEPPKGDLPPNLPTFGSPELGEAVGTLRASAVDTVLKVYATEADVILASAQLQDWSGKMSEEADKDFLASSYDAHLRRVCALPSSKGHG